jgi:hypothetical protein
MKLAKTLLYFTFDFNSDPLVSYRVISLVWIFFLQFFLGSYPQPLTWSLLCISSPVV